MTKLLIIRHGNTFNPDEPARRVGCKTDLPLTQSGIEQAKLLGHYLKKNNLKPNAVYASELQRAQQTAQIMLHAAGLPEHIQTDKTFNEIDHGPDENKTDADIIERIGEQALNDWAEFGVVPDGWIVDPRAVQQSWLDFAHQCVSDRQGDLTIVVSSGGIIRFAPVILPDPIENPKVKTASMSMLLHDGENWSCDFWNKRPE
jgi:probable phosphoglycerate mutase